MAYNRFIYYDNESGGYISQDLIGFGGGTPFLWIRKDCNNWVDTLGLNGVGVFDNRLADIVRQTHDVLRDSQGNATRGFNNSIVSVAEADVNGNRQIFASGSGATLTPAQRAKLKELGVPEENIFSAARYRTESKLEKHAERVIERNLPEGATIKSWGISWAGHKKNEMCPNCKEHFGHH